MYTTFYQTTRIFCSYLTAEDILKLQQQEVLSCDLIFKINDTISRRSSFSLQSVSTETLQTIQGSGKYARLTHRDTKTDLIISTEYIENRILHIIGGSPDEADIITATGERLYFYTGEGFYSSTWGSILRKQNESII